MPCSDEYTAFVVDQCSEFGTVTARKMFGGVGLYHNGLMFALIADDVLFFKADDSNRADYEALGYEPFKPYEHSTMVMQYYEVPADILENKYELKLWADKAYQAAINKKKHKSQKKVPLAKRAKSHDITVDDILHLHSVKIRAIAEQLRALIKETVPAAAEKAYPGWHGIGYRHPKKGYFCGIFPQADTVKLCFENGKLLADPHGLLEGAGKKVRYILFRTPDEIHPTAIKELLASSLNL